MTVEDVVGRLAAVGIRIGSVDGRLVAESFDGSTVGPESIKLLMAHKAELLERIRWLREPQPYYVPGEGIRVWGYEG